MIYRFFTYKEFLTESNNQLIFLNIFVSKEKLMANSIY